MQCALAVFEGLLPAPHDKIVQDLIFELMTWHGFAKLRLHTEPTLDSLGTSGTRVGGDLRIFQAKTCSAYETCELPSEEAAHGRRKAAAAKRSPNSKGKEMKSSKKDSTTRRRRKFNLARYKVHALGAYPKAIRLYGTSDGFSTQPVRNLPCVKPIN